MATSDKCHSAAIVVAHAREGVPDVLGTLCRVRVGLPALLRDRTFWVDVHEPDCRRAQGPRASSVDLAWELLLLQGTWPQGHALRTVGIINASEAHLLDGGAHAPEGGGARQDEEVSPAQRIPILPFERGHQRPCLVEVGVVRPAPLGLEALAATAAPALPIRVPVRAGAMPRQADEEGPVVSEVRRPAILGVCEQRFHLGLHGIHVEALQRSGVRFEARRL
mmetsp:Transcript_63753/g.176835  ORF Transcript_63753/g.176835 Transcript_63753/m.176835 type:complete len:222 (+) Transcript_63753:1057-1722(+)